MTSAPTNEFSTVEDKIEVAEGKKAAADKAFRDGNWQSGELKNTGGHLWRFNGAPTVSKLSYNSLALRSYHEVCYYQYRVDDRVI
jgi:hypothetical protein